MPEGCTWRWGAYEAWLLQAGFVHRDLRWENIACDAAKQHFFLLDLETVAPVDQIPGYYMEIWGDHTLQDAKYTPLSDLRMLGRMLHDLSTMLTSNAARHFMSLLTGAEGPTPQLTAQLCLQHDWIGCSGATCRAAGAQPDLLV